MIVEPSKNGISNQVRGTREAACHFHHVKIYQEGAICKSEPSLDMEPLVS